MPETDEIAPHTWLIVGGAPRSGTTAFAAAMNKSKHVGLLHEYASDVFFSALDLLFSEELRHNQLADFGKHADRIPVRTRDERLLIGDVFQRILGKRTVVVGTKFPGHQLWPSRRVPHGMALRELVLIRDPLEVEQEIARALRPKANHLQVLVRISGQSAQRVTVIGDVVRSTRLDLTSRRERLLDAVAAAGGTNSPVEKSTIQISRGDKTIALPLDTVIRSPRENVLLVGGDVITLYNQPNSFISLGAVAKPGETTFEATGVTLAQALGRVGGPLDGRADPSGVFVFRMTQGKPTVYRINLRDPGTIFVLREFQMKNGDVLYVSNSPTADFQKLVGVVGAALYPFDAARNIAR